MTTYVVNRADSRMIQRRGGSSLTLETIERDTVCGEGTRKKLDGDRSLQARICGLIHFTHSTRSQELHDYIRPNSFAGSNLCFRHWFGCIRAVVPKASRQRGTFKEAGSLSVSGGKEQVDLSSQFMIRTTGAVQERWSVLGVQLQRFGEDFSDLFP
jgi:hypothetical protein